MARFPAYANAGFAASWTDLYDATPDWNPVSGSLPDLPGLLVAYGLCGHGFKLASSIGRVIARACLGQATDVRPAPFALERFAAGRMPRGRCGAGAIS